MSDRSGYDAATFEWIFNIVDIGIHLIDHDGNTVFYNERMAEIDGLRREDVIGKNIFQLYPSLTEETSTLVEVLKTGKKIPEKIQTYITVTGQRITTINSTYPMLKQGRIIGALEVAKDITSIVQLHDQILDLRHQLYQSQQKERKHGGTAHYHFSDLIGKSAPFLSAVSLAKKAARTSSPVLICGPTGTGKELFAQSIHNAGARRTRPFVAQNCAAVPAELMEGIMFGTARGAFTGAVDRAGLFEQANGGTLFLDELNSLDQFLQAKLLRVLQDGFVRRVGAASEQQVNVRIIAAMNMDPEEALERGLLRHDLFFRLNVVHLRLPSLVERMGDVPLLAEHFVERFNTMFGMKIAGLSPAAMERLMHYHWPGNVRELSHAIESSYNMIELDTERIELEHLPAYLGDMKTKTAGVSPIPVSAISAGRDRRDDGVRPSGNLSTKLKQMEREAIVNALQEHQYNITLAAQALGLKRQALQYKIGRYGIAKK